MDGPRVETQARASANIALLLNWLSPSFPTGAFAYSQGLEAAVSDCWVTTEEDLREWLGTSLTQGQLWCDLAVASCVRRADAQAEIAELNALHTALNSTAERRAEALDLGGNFRDAYLAAWKPASGSAFDGLDDRPTYAVALALACRDHAIGCVAMLDAMATAYHTNAISAAIRLSVTGQSGGQRVIAGLGPLTAETTARAAEATTDDIATASFQADLASMRHETQTTRLFRS
jgi:urease accessory protein